MNTTILVTGGAGYIGTHACVELGFDNSNKESLNRVQELTGKAPNDAEHKQAMKTEGYSGRSGGQVIWQM